MKRGTIGCLRGTFMNALGHIFTLMGVAGFFVGIVAVIRPIQSLGLSLRRDGALVIGASLAIMILGNLISPTPRQGVAVASVSTTPILRPVSRADALEALTIGGFSWQKLAFGSVMTATFVIYNQNKFEVKDITVTCKHAANSGTKIDSNKRTVYERINANGYHSVVNLNMGFIHSAATSSTCQVTDFSRV